MREPYREPTVTMGTSRGRLVLVAMILGSGMAGLDGTVVNLALPAIGRSFDTGVTTLQLVVIAYLLTLAALILLGGSLGDRFGRRRVFLFGIVWFALASIVCAVAPSVAILISGRALQGIGGALLVPGSLAIIQATFAPEDRGRAIGAWSACAGTLATVGGPLVGGYLVSAASWRWVFLLNLPLAVAVVVLTRRHVPETCDDAVQGRVDLPAAVLAAAGLAGLAYALVNAGSGGPFGITIGSGAVGALCLGAFIVVEARTRNPMLPLDLFRSSQFTAVNIVTFLVYAGLGGMLFLRGVYLQVALGYSPIEAGLAPFPVAVIMLVASKRSGALVGRIGPRLPMSLRERSGWFSTAWCCGTPST